jgi:hypothetical protein
MPETLRPDAPRARPDGPPAGWLYRYGRGDRVALFNAIHPVTGDQLLTRYPEEARETGYGEPRLVGYLAAAAPVTGNLHRPPISIPWASRFGQAIRWGLPA